MTKLVTGCAGFIGSAVTRALLEAGHDVVGVDDLNDAYDTRLKRHRLGDIQGHARLSFHQEDVADAAAMVQLFGEHEPDQVFHLAARAGVRQSVVDPWIYTRTNVDGTLSLLEACRGHDVDHFLMASTSSLYGIHNQVPFKETDDTSMPLSPYAASKKGAEAMCATYTHLYGIHTIVPRYFTVYGPAGRPDMSVFRFIQWISQDKPVILYGDGEQQRDFTYIDDIAQGTLLAAKRLEGHQTINLGNDSPHSINELIALIESELGKRAAIERRPMHQADMQATWADVSKARGIGWNPDVSLAEGVRRAVEWHINEAKMLRTITTGAS